MGQAGPACRGHQLTTTRQHEQPGPQSPHLQAPTTPSSPAGLTISPRGPSGPARPRAGTGASQRLPPGRRKTTLPGRPGLHRERRSTQRGRATSLLGPAGPTHAVTAQLRPGPPQKVGSRLQRAPRLLGPQSDRPRVITAPLSPQVASDKPGMAQSSISSRPPCSTAWPRPRDGAVHIFCCL
ncbi:hypothetical protein NDU88_003523 [Pleurodeles waltl]|uniref:Uncharacterized protein n=1 Tax=Pleurodeles waltl TaxID=8319 RepID=A0AAV7V0U5_PLEWA|nr:hypothetical protein NDU88_003523 [Pleurodeles waltl]